MIHLPHWQNCQDKTTQGEPLNPLEQFIYDNEPAGKQDVGFRKQLRAMIEFMKGDKT